MKKNELKKKFGQASKHITSSKSDLVALGKAFHDIVKQHNRFRREVLKRDRMKEAKFAIKQCARNLWKFSEKLLSDDCQNDTQPSFDAHVAFDFFSKTYATVGNDIFSQPPWMPDVPAPSVPFHHDPITLEELAQTLKKCHCGSSPNPLDGIPYTILKRCPSLHSVLLHLYNTCLMTVIFPLCGRRLSSGSSPDPVHRHAPPIQ